MTVTPAYGRDYKSGKAAKEDWEAGKDFIINDMRDPYDGKPINLEDAKKSGIKSISIRYKKLTQVCIVKVEGA